MATVRASWDGRMRFTVTDPAGREIVVDTDPSHGGESLGIVPKQLMLMALAACTGMDVISVLTKKRQPVEAFAVTIHGHAREEPPRYYDRVVVEYVVTGDVDEAALERAISLSEEKYCAVYATMKHVAKMEHTYRIIRE